jgi:hypothetical protein
VFLASLIGFAGSGLILVIEFEFHQLRSSGRFPENFAYKPYLRIWHQKLANLCEILQNLLESFWDPLEPFRIYLRSCRTFQGIHSQYFFQPFSYLSYTPLQYNIIFFSAIFILYYMASFFNCVPFIGLLVEWKRHNGGLVLKNLIYIF